MSWFMKISCWRNEFVGFRRLYTKASLHPRLRKLYTQITSIVIFPVSNCVCFKLYSNRISRYTFTNILINCNRKRLNKTSGRFQYKQSLFLFWILERVCSQYSTKIFIVYMFIFPIFLPIYWTKVTIEIPPERAKKLTHFKTRIHLKL